MPRSAALASRLRNSSVRVISSGCEPSANAFRYTGKPRRSAGCHCSGNPGAVRGGRDAGRLGNTDRDKTDTGAVSGSTRRRTGRLCGACARAGTKGTLFVDGGDVAAVPHVAEVPFLPGIGQTPRPEDSSARSPGVAHAVIHDALGARFAQPARQTLAGLVVVGMVD